MLSHQLQLCVKHQLQEWSLMCVGRVVYDRNRQQHRNGSVDESYSCHSSDGWSSCPGTWSDKIRSDLFVSMISLYWTSKTFYTVYIFFGFLDLSQHYTTIDIVNHIWSCLILLPNYFQSLHLSKLSKLSHLSSPNLGIIFFLQTEIFMTHL